MRRNIGTGFMILGGAFLVAALSLILWNRREEEQAAEASGSRLLQVQEVIEEESTDSALPDPYDPEMKIVEIDGYGYIGYLSIPVLELELPVMADWSYPQLKVAPCRYYGSTKTQDLVIAAHNYQRHFGQIWKLKQGELVLFTDMDGVTTVYEVREVEELSAYAVEAMTAGDYDLTFFTCTYGGKSRVAVRCIKIEEMG